MRIKKASMLAIEAFLMTFADLKRALCGTLTSGTAKKKCKLATEPQFSIISPQFQQVALRFEPQSRMSDDERENHQTSMGKRTAA